MKYIITKDGLIERVNKYCNDMKLEDVLSEISKIPQDIYDSYNDPTWSYSFSDLDEDDYSSWVSFLDEFCDRLYKLGKGEITEINLVGLFRNELDSYAYDEIVDNIHIYDYLDDLENLKYESAVPYLKYWYRVNESFEMYYDVINEKVKIGESIEGIPELMKDFMDYMIKCYQEDEFISWFYMDDENYNGKIKELRENIEIGTKFMRMLTSDENYDIITDYYENGEGKEENLRCDAFNLISPLKQYLDIDDKYVNESMTALGFNEAGELIDNKEQISKYLDVLLQEYQNRNNIEEINRIINFAEHFGLVENEIEMQEEIER